MSRAMAAIAGVLLLSSLLANGADKKVLTYKIVVMGEIEDKAATKAGFHTKWWPDAHFGFTTYKASDGSALAVYYDDFDRPEDGKRFLDWKAANAFKVLSQSTKRNARGKPVKYRVELIPESDRSNVEVMWVVGAAVHWISARTLDGALAFEKLYGN
jgi:hypothetical protein